MALHVPLSSTVGYIKRVQVSQRPAIFLLFTTALSLALAGCAETGEAPSPSEQTIIDQGARLHQAIAPAVLNDDVNLRRYVQQVGRRLAGAAAEMHRAKIGPPGQLRSGQGGGERGAWMFGGDMRFQLLDCEVPNAFTPGGTHLYVYNGLFQQCRSEEELAAAMAHVYGHLYAQHRQQQPTLPDDAGAEEAVAALINNRHTPQQEREADAIGFEMFARAGWDPLAYGNLAQRLREAERADAARLMAEQLPLAALDWARPPIADAQRFAEYQKTAERLASRDLDPDLRLLLRAVPSCLTLSDQPEQREAQQQLLSPPVPVEIPAPFEKGPRARPR